MILDFAEREIRPLRRPCLNTLCHRFALMVTFAMIVTAFSALAEDRCAYDFPLDSNPTPITSKDVCNFHQVDAQIYRGGRPRSSAYPKFVDFGIRTILNLEEKEYAESERAVVDELNLGLPPEKQIQLVSIPIGPAEIETKEVPPEHVKKIFEEIRDAKRPIFIHCYHGKDRTGAIVAIYRMLMNQKSVSEAYDEAFHYGFSLEDHGLSKTVDRYKSEKKLKALPRPEPEK
jgi:protein tyrosine/serine phosphatase